MPPPKERETIKVQSERTILAAVRLPDSVYDQRNPFGELRALAEQAGSIVVGEMEQRKQRPDAPTYMGSGKVEELKALCEALNASVVIFDHDLSPRQIANIEEIVGRKILDRSELILDIFASRATTHEAKLQVELAQLQYTYPRLRAMWEHLERIVGAGGIAGVGTRGPGEQQLEIDRRLAQRKRLDLERELAVINARKRRTVQDRKKDHFTVGLVGYTNAGKSTLFNTLTEGGAYADDRLFATLVTRTRDWDLGGGQTVMLSDTVGFVRDLPHHLIASFRATLEEATHADLVLMVLDVSDPAAEMHYDTVVQTLDSLEEEVLEFEEREGNLPDEHPRGDKTGWRPPERLLLLNKSDRLHDNRDLLVWQRKVPHSIVISAIHPNSEGLIELRERVRAMADQGEVEVELTVPLADGKTLQRLENRSHVLDRQYPDDGKHVTMRVRVGKRVLDQLRSSSGRLNVRELSGPIRGTPIKGDSGIGSNGRAGPPKTAAPGASAPTADPDSDPA